MKHLINLFFLMFVTSLQAQHIGGTRKVTYEEFPNGEIRTEDPVRPTSKFNYTYNAGIPELSMDQVRELRDSGKTKISREKIKGVYSDFLFHFTPKFNVTLAILEKDNRVVSTVYTRDGKKEISWWYIVGLTSILLMFLLVKVNNISLINLCCFVIIFLFCIVGSFGSTGGLFTVTIGSVLIILLITAMIMLFISSFNINRSFKKVPTNIIYWSYNILIIVFFILCYLQL